jgi:hypothetical protein
LLNAQGKRVLNEEGGRHRNGKSGGLEGAVSRGTTPETVAKSSEDIRTGLSGREKGSESKVKRVPQCGAGRRDTAEEVFRAFVRVGTRRASGVIEVTNGTQMVVEGEPAMKQFAKTDGIVVTKATKRPAQGLPVDGKVGGRGPKEFGTNKVTVRWGKGSMAKRRTRSFSDRKTVQEELDRGISREGKEGTKTDREGSRSGLGAEGHEFEAEPAGKNAVNGGNMAVRQGSTQEFGKVEELKVARERGKSTNGGDAEVAISAGHKRGIEHRSNGLPAKLVDEMFVRVVEGNVSTNRADRPKKAGLGKK